MASQGAVIKIGVLFSLLKKDSIKGATQETLKIFDNFANKIKNLKIDDILQKQFNSALNSANNEFGKLNIGKITDALISTINGTDDIKEQQKAITDFIDSINLLKTATSGYTTNIFESLDGDQIQKLIDLTKEYLLAQTEVQKASAKNQINNIVSPLVEQYKEVEKLYQKIKEMNITDIANRLLDLNQQKDSGTFGTKQLREAIVLLQKYFDLLKQGDEIDFQNLVGISKDNYESIFSEFNKFITEKKNNLSDPTKNFLNNYNYIKNKDVLQNGSSSDVTLNIPVQPDFTGFHEGVESALKEEEAKGNVLPVTLKPKLTESFGDDLESKFNLENLHGIIQQIISKFEELKQAVVNVENTLANGLNVKPASELESEFDRIKESASSIPKTVSGSFRVASQEFKDYVQAIRSYKEQGGLHDISDFASNTKDISNIEKAYQKSVELSNNAKDKQVKQQEETAQKVKETNDLIGEKQVQAVQESLTAIKSATEEEIKVFNSINDSLEKVINNFGEVKKVFESNSSFNSFANELESIAISIESLKGKGSIKEVFQGLKLSKTNIENIKSLAPALEEINKQIDTLQLSDKSSAFVNQITELIKQGESLKSLATVLKSYNGANVKQLNTPGSDTDAYKEAKEILTELISLEKQRKTATGETAQAIEESIALYSDKDILDGLTKQINASEILTDAQKTEIDLLKQKVAIEKSSTDQSIKEQADAIARNNSLLEKTVEISKDNEEEWQKAARLLYGKNIYGESVEGAIKLKETLGDIVKITKKITVGKDGQTNALYTFKGTKGSTTIDQNGNFKNKNDTFFDISDELAAYEKSKKLINEFNAGNVEDYNSKYKSLIETLQKAQTEYSNFYETHTKSLKALNSAEYTNLANHLLDAVDAVDKLTTAEKGASEASRSTLLNNISIWVNNNRKGYLAAKDGIDSITDAIKELKADADISVLKKQFEDLTSVLNTAGLTGKTFAQKVSDQFVNKTASLVTTYLSIQDIIRYTQQALQTITELDDSLVDLSKTANMSTSQLNDFYLSSSGIAKQMGVTTKEIIDQASAWSRLGYNTNEAATSMAQLSSQFASISPGMSTDDAQSGLISIMKAWNVNVEDVKSEIMDNINALGNNLAESNSDIVEGMERSAAALASVGTDYKDAFAMFSGIQEVLQNAEVSGRALRSISMRIRGYDESTEELSDDLKNVTGELVDLTKTAQHTQGVSVFKEGSTTEFKSLVEYFGEIRDIWDEMSQKQQNDFLQKAFGKTQAQAGAALIQNYEGVTKALNVMNSAAGSSDREMSKIEDSISYKLNALKETWVGFLQVAANRASIKIIIDFLTKVSELLVKVLEMPGANVAVISGAIALLMALVQKAKDAASPLLTLSSIFKELFGKKSPLSNVQNVEKGVIETVNKMKETAQSGASSTQKTILGANGQVLTVVDTETTKKNTEANLENAASNEAKAASEIKDSAVKKDNIATTEADSAATEKNTKANKNNITALLSLAKAHPWVTAGIVGATVAITKIITLYQKEKQSVEDLASSVEELGETYQTNKKQIGGNISSIQSLYKEYQQLASGVDALGNNKGLSDENFDKYNDLTNQIAEKMPNLVRGWTDQGNAILVCKDNVTALNEEIEREQREIYTDVTDKESDILENYQNIVNGHHSWLYNTSGTEARKTQLQSAQKQIAELKKIISNQNSNNSFESYEYALKNPDASKRGSSYVLSDDFKKSSEIANQISTKWDSIIGHLNSLGVDTSKFDIQTDTIQSWDDLYNVITKVEKETLDVSSDVQEEEKSAVNDIQNLADAYLHLNDNYDKMSDGMKNGISTMINNLDVSDISDLGLDGDVAIEDFINGIVNACNSDTKVRNAITQLFSIDKNIPLSQAEIYVETYKKAILNALQNSKLGEKTKAYLRKLLDLSDVDWIDDEKEMVGSAAENAIDFNFQSEKAKLFGLENKHNRMDNQGVDTSAIDKQIEEQQKVISSAEEAKKVIMDAYNELGTEAERQDFVGKLNEDKDSILANVDAANKWVASLKQVGAVGSNGSFNMADFSSAISSLEKVNTAYQKVAENIKANKIGKEIVSNINDIESLREEFKDLDESTLDWGNFKDFDDIERVLTDSSSSASEMQEAFDQLGTTLLNAKMAADDYSEASATMVSSQLQQAGITKESADAFVEYQAALGQSKQYLEENGQDISKMTDAQILFSATLSKSKKELVDSGKDVADMTDAEIIAMAAESNQAGATAQQLNVLKIAQYACNAITINTSADIENLYNLMVQAGATADELNRVAVAKSLMATNESYLSKIKNAKSDTEAARYEKLYQQNDKRIQALTSTATNDFINNYKEEHPLQQGLGNASGSGGGGGGGGGSDESDTKDKYVEEFEKQYEKLGELRDNDKIDEYEYCQYLRALYEKFFKDKEKYAEQYEKYEHEYLSGMKDLYDNVFSYLSGQIDKQISKLNDQKSAATENLKSQKESAVNALKAEKEAAVAAIEAQIDAIKEQQKQIQKKIDAYQDEIDAINDANEARERELTLQKALYDLDKLQNQRINLVYSESQGMHYEADLSGIRDARESVQDAKDDIAIANLQKKIDLLEKEKDALDEQIDALEEQKQAIEDYYDDLISQTEEYWDNLIAESEKYYDNLVKQLQGQKDLISEWQDALENAKFNAIIKDLTGKDAHEIFGNFENFDTSKLEELKGLLGDLAAQYVSLETTMNADNTHVLDSFAEMNNLDLTKIPNYLEATSAGFDKLASCDFDVVKNGVEGIRTAFETLTNDKDAFATVGQHLSESFTNGFKDAVENEDVSPVCGAYGNALTQGFNAYFADSEHTAEVGRYVTEGIGNGMASDDAKSAIDDASSEIADYIVEKSRQDMQINSPSELLASEVGLYAGLGVPKGIVDSLGNPEFQSYLQQFVDGVAQKLHDAFSQLDTSNLLDLSSIFGVVEDTGEEGNSTANIFSQLLEDIQAFADAFANIDITNVVTQFTDLRDAVLDVSSAIGGTTGASESGDQAQGGTGRTSKQSKKYGAKGGNSNQQSNSGGSLTEAMQSFGDTATKVLGGGGEEGDEEEGSGVIGQFATLKTKVEDVTAAIGTEDDSGGDGKSGGKGKGKGKGKGEDSGTLIEALKSEQEVAFDEEKGLPAQNEQWSTLESNIQKCVDAVQRLIDKLKELEEFSLTVNFAGSSGGGGAEADGTFASHASGSFPITMHSYAKGSNVGLEHDQRALIGEVGYEGLVRQNRFSLIGKNGAEMMSLKKGDIIFSHSQTKELLKNGKIHSRGKAVGTHSYADGTPLKSALKFAGADYSSTQLAALATKLTGVIDGISVGIDSIERRTTELANKVPNVTTNTANKTSNMTIGDIHVSGVQDVDSFAKAVKSYLPGRMLQELHKN